MAEIDSLEIKLKSNAKDLSKDFDTLSNSIDKLSGGTKSLTNNLHSIAKAFKDFANELNTIDSKGLDKVNQLMNNLSKTASKGLGDISKVSNELDKGFNSKKIQKSKQSVDEFMASIKGLGKNQQFFGTASQVDREIETTRNKIEKIKTSLEAYNQEGKSVETKCWRTAQRQLEQYSNYLDNLLSKQKQLGSNPTGFKFDEQAIANSKDNIYKLLLSNEEYTKMREGILAKGIKPIEIPVEIDTESLDESLGGFKNYDAIDVVKEKVSEVGQQAKVTAERMSLMFEPSTLGKGQKFTDEYKSLEKEILATEKELEKYLNTQEKLESLGVKKESQRYKNVALNIEQADAKLQLLNADMKNLQASGKDVVNPNQFDRLSESVSNAQGIMLSLSKALRAGGFGSAASTVQKLGADVGSLSGGMSQLGASAESASGAMAGMSAAIPIIGLILAAVTLLIKAFTSLTKAVVNAMKKIGSAIKGIITKVRDLLKSILSIGTASNQAHTIVGKFINKIVGLFKSRILRQAITQAIQYMKDGFASLDVYSNSIGSKFHTNVQTIIADLKWLGRTIAAAFEPIINVATPILDFLIDKLVTVINYINQFFAALSGSKTWTKAVKTASDYSSATGGAAKAQKDLNKQIREWDKLNVITDPNKNSSGGGGSTSGASGDGFVTEDVSNSIKDLAKRIKETWDTDADFTWLGTEIGTKVKDTLDKIPWEEKIKPAAAKFGTALATLINGFVEVPGLADTIGKTIAQAINTALTFLENFTSNIHGDSIGTFIGELVGSALRNIEWDKYITSMGNLGRELAKGINALANTDVLSEISKAFAKILKGAIEGAYQFVTNLDFKNLGTKVGNAISDFFKEMNEKGEDGKTGFQKLGETLSKTASGIMDFLINALDSLDWDEIGQSVIDFISSIDWGELFLKAVELKKKIGDAVWEMIKLAFKSITIAEGDITLDIAKAVKDKFDNAKNWLADKAMDFKAKIPTFEEIKSGLETLVSNIKGKLEATFGIKIPTFEELKQGFDNLITNIKNKLESTFNIKIPTFEEIKQKVENLVKQIVNTLQGTFNFKVPSVDTVKQKLKNVTSAIKKAFKFNISLKAPSWDSIKQGFINIVNKIKSLFKLDLKFKTDAKAQTASTSIVGNTVKKIVNKVTGRANGGIYSHGNWQKFATGGFPTHGSAFIAGESGAEMVGHINGQTEVLNKSQIAQAMSSAVVSGNAEQNALLRQQNQLLMQILEKESGISYKDVFKATQKGNNEYKAMNGVSAFI